MPLSAKIIDNDFLESIEKLSKLKPEDLKPAFNTIGQAFALQVRRSFDTESDPFSVRWFELSARYLRSKLKKQAKYPREILKWSGSARNNVRFRVLKNGVNIYINRTFPDGQTMELHQYGGISMQGWLIPPRPMLPDPDEELPREWEMLWQDVMDDLLFRKGGFR